MPSGSLRVSKRLLANEGVAGGVVDVGRWTCVVAVEDEEDEAATLEEEKVARARMRRRMSRRASGSSWSTSRMGTPKMRNLRCLDRRA